MELGIFKSNFLVTATEPLAKVPCGSFIQNSLTAAYCKRSLERNGFVVQQCHYSTDEDSALKFSADLSAYVMFT